MYKTTCCRVCLADGVQMHTLLNTKLQELYENLSNAKLQPHEGKPSSVCYLCHALLQKCHKLRDTARRSESILSQLYSDGVTVTSSKLSLYSRPALHAYVATTVEHVNIDHESERDRYTCETKTEGDGECFNMAVKEENGLNNELQAPTLNYPYEPSIPIQSTEVTIAPRLFSTRDLNKSCEPRLKNLYLEIDGLKQSLMHDLGIKVSAKESQNDGLTSDTEPMRSNSKSVAISKSDEQNFRIESGDNSQNFESKNYEHNLELQSRICSQNLDSGYDSRIANLETNYTYNKNLKTDQKSSYDNVNLKGTTKTYETKKFNTNSLQMTHEYSITNSQNLDLTSEMPSSTRSLEFESRLTDHVSSYDSDSEDDLPLKMLRKRSKKKRSDKKEEDILKRDYRKGLTTGSSVILIGLAEQMQAMNARASNHNYLYATFKCEYCYRGFLTEEVYAKHMEKHDEARGAYACPLCALRYRSPRLLSAHAHAAHERRYRCDTCAHVSTTKNQASDHQRVHTGDLFECKMCSKSFHARTTFLTHMRARHPTPDTSCVCTICGSRCVSSQGLAMHRAKMHAHITDCGVGELATARGFVCTCCGERFQDQQQLNTHRTDKHNGAMEEDNARADSKYCDSCDIHFLTRKAYTRHILSTPAHLQLAAHTKECPICLQTIQGTVRSHMKIHDRETKPKTTKPAQAKLLHCEQCPQSFANKSRLNAHVRRIHLGLKYNKNLVCEVCGKHCTSGATLRYHQRTHTGERPYPCGACGARFPDSNQLRIHSRTHSGERPYCCHTCGKSFAQRPALNRHSRVHTGVKPHTCDICSKSFTQSNSLNTHIKSVHLKMPRKLYPKNTYARKTSQNAAETKKSGNLPVTDASILNSNTIVESSDISEVTLVDSQVHSKININMT